MSYSGLYQAHPLFDPFGPGLFRSLRMSWPLRLPPYKTVGFSFNEGAFLMSAWRQKRRKRTQRMSFARSIIPPRALARCHRCDPRPVKRTAVPFHLRELTQLPTSRHMETASVDFERLQGQCGPPASAACRKVRPVRLSTFLSSPTAPPWRKSPLRLICCTAQSVRFPSGGDTTQN